MNMNSFSRAEEVIRQQIVDGIMPCAVMAARQGNEIRISAFNTQAKPEPALRSRIFLLASISKSITGTLFAVLHENGIIRFTDRLCDYLPEMTDSCDLDTTIGNVFTHCTGYSTGVDLIDRSRFTPEDYYLKILRDGRSCPPRTGMRYSTMTYQFLSAIIYRVTGLTLIESLKTRIFDQAGMINTSFNPDPGQCIEVVDGVPFEALAASEMAGAGLWSTLDDLLNFATSLMSGKLISTDTLREITAVRDILPMLDFPGTDSRRTWGWNKAEVFPEQPESGFYHGGATGNLLWLDPEADFTFILLSNRWGCGNEHSFSILKNFYI